VVAEKYDRLRRVIGLTPDTDLAAWVTDLNTTLGLPRSLADMGVPRDILPRIAELAEQDPATHTNPRTATRADYQEMLRSAFGD
jgi:alcohol dehydrogenase class IV